MPKACTPSASSTIHTCKVLSPNPLVQLFLVATQFNPRDLDGLDATQAITLTHALYGSLDISCDKHDVINAYRAQTPC